MAPAAQYMEHGALLSTHMPTEPVLATRLSLCRTFSHLLFGLDQPVLRLQVMGSNRLKSQFDLNPGSTTQSLMNLQQVNDLCKACSFPIRGSNKSVFLIGPRCRLNEIKAGKDTIPGPDPGDSNVGGCSNVFLSFIQLPNLQALLIQQSHIYDNFHSKGSSEPCPSTHAAEQNRAEFTTLMILMDNSE